MIKYILQILCTLVSCILIYTNCFAWGVLRTQSFIAGSTVASGGAAFCVGGELFCVDFEDNQTCASHGFNVESGTVTCQATDYKIDSYGMKLSNSGTLAKVSANSAFAETDPIFIKFSCRFSDSSNINYFFFFKNATSDRSRLHLNSISGGRLDLDWGTTLVGFVLISSDTWYTVKIKYNSDSGSSDGYMYMWVTAGENITQSTDTGDADVSGTSLSGQTSNINGFDFRNDEDGDDIWIDNIVVLGTDPDA